MSVSVERANGVVRSHERTSRHEFRRRDPNHQYNDGDADGSGDANMQWLDPSVKMERIYLATGAQFLAKEQRYQWPNMGSSRRSVRCDSHLRA